MRKNLNFLISVILICIVALGVYIATKPNKDLPINYISGDYVIDMKNPKEVVGLGDYVFVAQVNEEIKTVHRNIKEIGTKKIGMPYTIYTITVIDNLKGKIKKNTPIEFEKFGGVNIDNKSISLSEGDVMLEEGEYYIIVASSEPDGRLAQGGPTAVIKLDVNSKDDIKSSQEYKDYVKYCKEEKKFERTRFKSKYEE